MKQTRGQFWSVEWRRRGPATCFADHQWATDHSLGSTGILTNWIESNMRRHCRARPNTIRTAELSEEMSHNNLNAEIVSWRGQVSTEGSGRVDELGSKYIYSRKSWFAGHPMRMIDRGFELSKGYIDQETNVYKSFSNIIHSYWNQLCMFSNGFDDCALRFDNLWESILLCFAETIIYESKNLLKL